MPQNEIRGSTQIMASSIPSSKVAPAAFSSGGTVFIDKEDLVAQIGGGNLVFTLANTPFPGSEHVFWRGTLRKGNPAAGYEYTLSGATITFLVAPETGDDLVVSYRIQYT